MDGAVPAPALRPPRPGGLQAVTWPTPAARAVVMVISAEATCA